MGAIRPKRNGMRSIIMMVGRCLFRGSQWPLLEVITRAYCSASGNP
jgi:hypothetical protein